MNTNFMLFDKNNNLQKQATTLIKFNYEENDYLIYSIEENEQNKQIFVSKIILNSEGKYFIESITPEDKSKLNNIVYNIIIMIPSNYKKGGMPEDLINDFSKKYSVTLSKQIPVLEDQEYFSNCSVAITSSTLLNNANDFYLNYLDSGEGTNLSIPTWTIPVIEENQNIDFASAPNIDNQTNNFNNEEQVSIISHVQNSEELPSNESHYEILVSDDKLISTPNNNLNSTPLTVSPVVDSSLEVSNIPNPQAEKLAIVSDPNLGSTLGVDNIAIQPNLGRQKKAGGFASSKYIIIGTVCLFLAVVVIVVAIILIKNK